MTTKTRKIIRYIATVIAVAMLVLFVLYEFAGKEWARKPFLLTIALVCLYKRISQPASATAVKLD